MNVSLVKFKIQAGHIRKQNIATKKQVLYLK